VRVRLLMLAIVFLLVLTLVNALMLKHDLLWLHNMNWAPVHLGIRRERHYGWDLFVWREIGALFITMLLFGAIASLRAKRSTR
jgi:hypothetical protein